MPVRIVRAVTYDIRFPTSRSGAGSDAMNTDPDYSAAYVALETDHPTAWRARAHLHDRPRDRGLRRRDRGACAARRRRDGRGARRRPRRILAPARHGLAAPLARPGERRDPPGDRGDRERRLGSVREARGQAALEAARGHDAGADRRLRRLPLHRRRAHPGRGARDPAPATRRRRPNASAILLAEGFPAYTTSAGWLGYPEETLPERARDALAEGFTHLKLKVGGDLESDLRRARAVRDAIGPEHRLSLDANQAWGVDAGDRVDRLLAEVDPWWIEEPTSPDDVLGHATDPRRGRAGTRRDRRARAEPRRLQAAAPARRDRRLPGRLLPARRRERGAGGRPARREVRRSDLPPRRRRRPLRVRAARVDVRLRRRRRHVRRPRVRVRRPPARAFRRPGPRRREAAISRRRRRASASRSGPIRLSDFAFPDGPGWRKDEEVPA